MTLPYDSSSPSHPETPAKRGSGCIKWGAILGSSFLIFMGLVTSCGADTVEVEVPGPTVTQTVTSTMTTTEKATTITKTVTESSTEEEPVQEAVEPAAAESHSEPDNNINTPRGFAAIPAPAPAPAPAQASYANCAAVRAAGAAPLYRGSPGYSSKLDRDGDGVACE